MGGGGAGGEEEERLIPCDCLQYASSSDESMFELSNSLPASPMPSGLAEQQQAETQALTSNGGNGHSVARIGHDEEEEEEEEEELSPSAAPSAGVGGLLSPIRLVFSPSLRSTSLRLCLLYFLMAFVYYGLVLLAMNVVVEEEEQGQHGNQKREVSKKKKQRSREQGCCAAS